MPEILLALALVNALLLISNGVCLWRHAVRLRHVRVMDIVMTQLCVATFRLQHLPLWVPWSQAMGSLEVEVKAQRREWGDDVG